MLASGGSWLRLVVVGVFALAMAAFWEFDTWSLALPWVGFVVGLTGFSSCSSTPSHSVLAVQWLAAAGVALMGATAVSSFNAASGISFADAVILPTADTHWTAMYFGDPLRPSLVGNLLWLAAWFNGGLQALMVSRAVLYVIFGMATFAAIRAVVSFPSALFLTAMVTSAFTMVSVMAELGSYATALTSVALGSAALLRGSADRWVYLWWGLAALDLPIALLLMVGWRAGVGLGRSRRFSPSNLAVLAFVASFSPAVARALMSHGQGEHGDPAQQWMLVLVGPLLLGVAWVTWRAGRASDTGGRRSDGERWQASAGALGLASLGSWALSMAGVLPGERYLLYLTPLGVALGGAAFEHGVRRRFSAPSAPALALLVAIAGPRVAWTLGQVAQQDEWFEWPWKSIFVGVVLLLAARVIVDRPAFRPTRTELNRLGALVAVAAIWITLSDRSLGITEQINKAQWYRRTGIAVHDQMQGARASAGSKVVRGLLFRTSPTLLPLGWTSLVRADDPLPNVLEAPDPECVLPIWVGAPDDDGPGCRRCSKRWASDVDNSGMQITVLSCAK